MEKRSIGFEIKALNNMIAKKLAKETKATIDCQVSHVQIKIIHYLVKNQNKIIFQKDIEKALLVSRATVSGILNTMEKNQFIKRLNSKEDARMKQIKLTEKALSLADLFQKKAIQFDKLLGDNISSRDLNTFFKVIDQMKINVSK